MKVFIVEDEQLAVAKLTQTLSKVVPDAEIIGIADSVQAAVAWFGDERNAPDVVLMDIELADGQSFAIFDQVQVNFPVIFTTSYDEFALKAFRVNSIAYLLKPIQQEELNAALAKLRFFGYSPEPVNNQRRGIENMILEMQRSSPNTNYKKRFLVKQLQKLVPVEVSSIAYFYCEDRVNFLRTSAGKSHIVDYTLDEIESMVDPSEFFRINRSVIVWAGSLVQIQPYFNNRLILQLAPDFGKEAIVSREKVNEFKQWLGK